MRNEVLRHKFLGIVTNLPLFAIAALSGKTAAQDKVILPKPNILVIITDQQSADAMSNRIGNKYINTPNMDWLANHGITYTRAYCANPLSIPSRTSMFTGYYPHETGLQSNENVKLNVTEFPSMGTIFQKAGYETGYSGKWHLPYDPRDKASHGFQYMEQIKNNGVDTLIPAAALEFIKKKRDKPFLFVASFVNPHNICEWARSENLPDGKIDALPPLKYCPPLKPNHAPAEFESDIVKQLRINYHASPKFPVGNFSDSTWREYRWAYYRLVEKTDNLIGKILEGLRSTGLDKNTIIILLADHGDAQGAHLWNQKTLFFEEIVKIPFIVSFPGMEKAETCDGLIQTGIDLIPTICDYAGITLPSYSRGISAGAIYKANSGKLNREFIVVSDKPVQGNEVNGLDPKPDGRMVVGGKYKYWIYSEGKQRESLFDLTDDPGEMVNLATNPKYSAVLLEYRSYLRSWCKKYNDSFIRYLLN